MKLLSFLYSVMFSVICLGQTLTSFHSFNEVTITGDTISLSQFAGKKVLVVNTASFCAYTHQYNDLQNLYNQFGGDHFEILGFPCNNFGNQEPGSDSVIFDFCTGTYNVTFQMMKRINIKQGDTAEVYKWLQRGELNGVDDAQVTWNFHKFLIDENGNWVRHFPSTTSPLDTAITNWITSDLNTVSLNDAEEKNIDLYPNPSAGLAQIKFKNPGKQIIRVFNALGQQILSETTLNPYFEFNLSTKGIYFISIESGQNVISKRLLIQ
jgi:glutathione peroxidase